MEIDQVNRWILGDITEKEKNHRCIIALKYAARLEKKGNVVIVD